MPKYITHNIEISCDSDSEDSDEENLMEQNSDQWN